MPSAAHSSINASAYTVRPPVVSFTASVSGQTVSVDCSASYGTSSPIVLSSWNFGDGATATGVTQTHTYASAATYTITYTATQGDGGTASTSQTVVITASSSAATTKIITPGDSLTYGQDGGGTTWPQVVGSDTGLTVVNPAAAGWTSVDQAVLMGAIDFTAAGPVTIPASGNTSDFSVNETGFKSTGGIAQHWLGTFAGVAGTLYHNVNTTTFYFQRTSSGSALSAPNGADFHCTQYDAYVGQGYGMVIMLGRNDMNYSGYTQTIENSVDAILSRFNPNHYLILGTIALTTSSDLANVNGLDSALQSHYGTSHFMSVQSYLASTAAMSAVGLTPTATDNSQISSGYVPDSLSTTSDRPHLNANGYTSLGHRVSSTINSLGWLSSGGGSSGGTQPTGSGIVRYQDLSGSTFDARWDNAGSSAMSLAAGTFSFNDFAADSSQYGADTGTSQGILGSGVAYTTIQMNANTSTKGSVADSGSVNPYYLLEQSHITGGTFDGFTLNGTSQGHDYNGLRSDYATGVTFSNLKIINVPGSSPSPPGETFYVNVYAGTNPVFNTVEFDGNWVSASTGATNGSVKDSTSAVNGTLTYTHVFGHEIQYGKIYAGWQTFGGGTFTQCMCVNTSFGYGFEECGGTFTFNDCIFGGNIADIHLGNSHANRTQLVINDPVFLNGQTKIKAYIPPSYSGNGGGNGNAQSASDITITVNGVDMTSTMLQVITTWQWNSDGSYKGTPISYTRPSWIPWS